MKKEYSYLYIAISIVILLFAIYVKIGIDSRIRENQEYYFQIIEVKMNEIIYRDISGILSEKLYSFPFLYGHILFYSIILSILYFFYQKFYQIDEKNEKVSIAINELFEQCNIIMMDIEELQKMKNRL